MNSYKFMTKNSECVVHILYYPIPLYNLSVSPFSYKLPGYKKLTVASCPAKEFWQKTVKYLTDALPYFDAAYHHKIIDFTGFEKQEE